ncbi:MAG: metal ABC transporter ATP-binding protein [Actinomycetota bacterium]|nr:metal ABC transporter ATP-binding protein [Actinomycetota bacterium]
MLAYVGCGIGYADTRVVHDVDLRIEQGESVALLGPNGSGKTTLVRAALGLARIQTGRLELFGTPVHKVRDRARVGYVPQRHTVATSVPATVAEVVACGRLARTSPLRRMARRARAEDAAAVQRALDVVGLAHRARTSVAELSGGQQRRVLIARALAADPDVLILDEPTAGVDSASQLSLAVTLADLSAGGTTLVVVTHELAALADVVARAVVMRDGRVAHDGPLDGAQRTRWDEPGHHHPDDHHVEEPHVGDPHDAWLPRPQISG